MGIVGWIGIVKVVWGLWGNWKCCSSLGIEGRLDV